MRTFSRDDWEAAQRAWADGQFSPEWREIRHRMAMQGCIFPPSGDRHDSWDDDAPSQRAMLIRALRETPDLLARCSAGAKTWHQVIERLTRARDEWRAESAADEFHRRTVDLEERATHKRAVMSLGQIIGRISDSRP